MFSTVDTALSLPGQTKDVDEQLPTTPTTRVAEPVLLPSAIEDAVASTPTKHSFGGVLGQRPLPDEPFASVRSQHSAIETSSSLKRDGSPRSGKSAEGEDIEMGEGDHEEQDGEDDGSENDSVTSGSHRPSKKKKGQRFFCTGFPPCQLSFTRSEHLARHIRKHTGERPFQCHCSHRFSRLDNLRQHAQTVHVNEEIPGDSLAATSTRFQRQIRTDRVRPPTNRARASTVGSQGGHSRGHSRNLSSSSIGSTTSSAGVPEDTRRRPQPLAMASDPSARPRPTLDPFKSTGSPGPQYAFYSHSPNGQSTPTSSNFSTGLGSPGFASPSSTLSRSSFYNGARHAPTHQRRLSVPAGSHPFPPGTSYPPAYFSPIPSGSSATFSQSGSIFGSPTSSVFTHSRRDSETELEYRRRTWHSGTYPSYSQRPATSGLSYQQTPDDQAPTQSNQPTASQVTRLPGIESFDHAPPTSGRPQVSPMLIDARPSSSHRGSDAGLHQNLTRLDIATANAPMETQWQTQPPVTALQHSGYFPQQNPGPATIAPEFIHHQHSASMPEPVTPRRNKRQAWYGGPVQAQQQYHHHQQQQQQQQQPAYPSQRTSPEDSGSSDGVPTPSAVQGTEYHPVIIAPNGVPEAYAQGVMLSEQHKTYLQPTSPSPAYLLQAGHDPGTAAAAGYHQPSKSDLGRLEALVAVATSEGAAVENRS